MALAYRKKVEKKAVKPVRKKEEGREKEGEEEEGEAGVVVVMLSGSCQIGTSRRENASTEERKEKPFILHDVLLYPHLVSRMSS